MKYRVGGRHRPCHVSEIDKMTEQTAEVVQPNSILTKTLSLEEQRLIQHLLTSESSSAEEVIPSDIEPNQLWLYLTATCKTMSKVSDAMSKLKPFMGRLFIILKKHPHLYQQQGYETYDEFMTNGVPKILGISRADAYNCSRMAEVLGFLPSQKLAEFRFSKCNVLASALQRDIDSGMSPEKVQETREFWVKAAENSTVEELKQRIYDKALADQGSLDLVSLTITVTKPVKQHWQAFWTDASIRAYCGSEAPGSILERAMQECESEWLARAGDA